MAGKYVYFAAYGDKNSSSSYCIKVHVYSTDGLQNLSTIIGHVPRLMDTKRAQTAVRKLHLDKNGFIYVLSNSDILVF